MIINIAVLQNMHEIIFLKIYCGKYFPVYVILSGHLIMQVVSYGFCRMACIFNSVF